MALKQCHLYRSHIKERATAVLNRTFTMQSKRRQMCEMNAPGLPGLCQLAPHRAAPASKASDAELQRMCLNNCLASCRADVMHLDLADAEGNDDMRWAPADCEGNNSNLTVIPEHQSLGCMCCSSTNCKQGCR